MKQFYFIAFWSPFEVSDQDFCLNYFIYTLSGYCNIQWVNLGNQKDKRTLDLLQEADLVILGLKQDSDSLDRFFCRPLFPYRKVLYLILDYMTVLSPTREEIATRYRLPLNEIGVIPYNIRYADARRSCRTFQYIVSESRSHAYEHFVGFHKELERNVRLILWALEMR